MTACHRHPSTKTAVPAPIPHHQVAGKSRHRFTRHNAPGSLKLFGAWPGQNKVGRKKKAEPTPKLIEEPCDNGQTKGNEVASDDISSQGDVEYRLVYGQPVL